MFVFVMIFYDIFEFIINKIWFYNAVKHFKIGKNMFKTLIPAFNYCPFLIAINLINSSKSQKIEKLLILFFSAIVNQLFFK